MQKPMAEIIEPTPRGQKNRPNLLLLEPKEKKNDATIRCLEWVALVCLGAEYRSWIFVWAVSQFSHVTTKTHWGMNFQSKPFKFESYSIHMESIVWWIFDSPTASKAPDNFWPYLCIDPDKSLRVSTICTHRHWLHGYTHNAQHVDRLQVLQLFSFKRWLVMTWHLNWFHYQ